MLAGRRLKILTIFSLHVIDIIYNAMKCSKLFSDIPHINTRVLLRGDETPSLNTNIHIF